MERTSQSALSTSNQEQCQQPVSKYFSFWALHQMQHTNHYSASPPTTRLPRLNKTATATQIDSAVLQPFLSLWIYAIQNHHHRQMELCTLPDALNIWQTVLKVWLLCNQHLHPCNYEQRGLAIPHSLASVTKKMGSLKNRTGITSCLIRFLFMTLMMIEWSHSFAS